MTTQSIEHHPKKVDVVIVNDEADNPSLLNPMTGQIFVTNGVGKRVYELADGTRTLDEIVDEISRHYKGAPRDRIREEVGAFLEEGAEKGLLTWEEVKAA